MTPFKNTYRRYLKRPLDIAVSGYARPMIASRFDHRYVRQCLLDFYDKIMPTRENYRQ